MPWPFPVGKDQGDRGQPSGMKPETWQAGWLSMWLPAQGDVPGARPRDCGHRRELGQALRGR